jgi:hypothetical protein|tara:strand:- start:35 stop:340 length:306 start_codon:yes stop_codon:yes gene_type:complete
MASKEYKEKLRKNKAKLDDLIHYFGRDVDEWINRKDILISAIKDTWRGKQSSEYPPYTCTECNRYWSHEINQSTKKKQYNYLKKSVFNGVLCKKIKCPECS